MSQPAGPTESRIVMAEQSSHDVVNQTLSGGEPSPSDVPASTTDKTPAGGDVGEFKDTATTTPPGTNTSAQQGERKMDAAEQLGQNGAAKDADQPPSVSVADMDASIYLLNPTQDTPKSGLLPVAARALEMNGMTSGSDGGEDTASQGGSESDASRTDGRFARAGSKKPTSFKPVTFAKFSVPKAPGTPPITKASEKAPVTSTTPLGTPPPTSRPRLVVKSTSSLRDSLSKTGMGAIRPGAGGPDPNQVWNKNRPVQQTPPKHLTDEELKQQYGIHMTSRIQEDGGGGEGKWADIDDDEDDWAPETIEWTDGTKTDLTQQPEPAPAAPAPPQEKAAADFKNDFPPVEQAAAVAAAVKEPAKFVPKPVTSIGPNPTVLRLGANAERQAKSAIIAAKGPNDKSPLLSTSPAPPPVKSPWAQLPPVEKISPVIPPVQVQPLMRPPLREPHLGDGPLGPLPPKEIAADDFNRSWREMQSGTRELYNSRSGRYEPVAETRKGAWRAEQNFRAPSLLQRPAHGEQAGPAEPSAAFQTHRSSGQDGMHWPRRRTSSNVSGGSGSFGRRMSIGRPDMVPKVFESRRGSQVNGMIESSLPVRDLPPPKDVPLREVSPSRRGPGPWPSRGAAHVQDRMPNMPDGVPQPPTAEVTEEQAPAADVQPPQAPQENPVAMQERIMKEKRLEARQRRIEQEEREEAAKRERIRQKLEALGPAPDKSKPRCKESLDSGKAETNPPQSAAQAFHSPPKPPVPEPTGEPKQYGMMKVHHPDTVKKLVERERAPEKAPSAANARRTSSPARESKQDASAPNGSQQQPGDTQVPSSDKAPEAQTDEQSPQWRGNLNAPSTYLPWSPNPKFVGTTPPTISNPWKPLSNDKTLGNGIFEQSLGGFPARDISLRSHLGLDQPAMAPGSQPFSAPSRSPQENASIPPLASPEVRHVSYDAITPLVRPGPIGPPSSQHSHRQHESRAAGTAAWNNFHSVATKREAEENEKLRNEFNAMPQGPSSLQVTFNETWKQVRTGDQAGQRQVVGITRSSENNPPLAAPLPGFDHPVNPLPFTETPARPLGSVPVRSSRFFPQATEPPRKPAADDGDFYRSPSPPPPEEMSSHPVYTGNSNRPLVHLPAPKPIVKLPPKVIAPPPPPPTFASMVAAPPRSNSQHVTSWQEKINTLFGKKTVPEKRNALAVTSATKEPLDVQLHIAAVSVSLPYNGESHIGDGEMTAKQVEEAEEIFEDREVGSLPVVRVPTRAPPAAWQAAPPPSQSRLRSKHLKSMQVHSIEPFLVGFQDRDSSGNTRVSIRFPGAALAKTLSLPRKTGPHTSRPRGPSSFKPRKNTKPREAPGNPNTKKPATSQQPNGSSSPRRQSRNASWGPRTFSGSQ
ncbi:hypothetical protein BO70DRAFT_367865 [Aspergillus heteromorphus CBS 117.55]|uniref:PI-PLC Y-box domain-containing protein n=1 Tax=Aspergillus heteromorphus CBS 117.55 TaxID=1448321 RepID=A0A317X5J5_9EURO|nr:uncharacterized protein BO70DRAFT_367865 [Aspergillus heteromorphus CBS 117.55]PWY92892.1 hypothetical protein BO70DRAFT_367865 [Aspergillus heteromorphus CBS 117.55]